VWLCAHPRIGVGALSEDEESEDDVSDYDSQDLVVGERGGDVFAWGNDAQGQLGRGTRAHQRTPALVPGLPAVLRRACVVMVAAGACHSAASTSAGELLVWGINECGQLGLGDREGRTAPAMLGPERFGGSPVLMVACGEQHTVTVTEVGRVFTFGYGGFGQLGLGDKARFGGVTIAYAAAGGFHSGVVTSDGRFYTWGLGGGHLGHNDCRQEELMPRELMGQFGGSSAVMLAAGEGHTVFLMTDGALWDCGSEPTACWGSTTPPAGSCRRGWGRMRRSGRARSSPSPAAFVTRWL